MEYILSQRDAEVIQEIKTEADAKLNAEINAYLTAVLRQQKMPPEKYGYVLSDDNTKIVPKEGK